MTFADAPDTLSVPELARLARRRPETVRAALESGELRGARHGHGWRVSKRVAARWAGVELEPANGASDPEALRALVRAAAREGVREVLGEILDDLADRLKGHAP